MKELKELKKLEEQNRLNETLTRLNTKTHKSLHKSIASNSSSNNTNSSHTNGASTNVNTTTKNTTGNSKTNSTSNDSRNGSSKSLTSENSLNAKNSAAPHDLDELNRINLIESASQNATSNGDAASAEKREELTWIHELFQGILVNETKCLNCETSSSKEENFLDLSVDVEQNTSISHCLQEFSNMEMLCGECKYYCENCCSKQEAEKRLITRIIFVDLI